LNLEVLNITDDPSSEGGKWRRVMKCGRGVEEVRGDGRRLVEENGGGFWGDGRGFNKLKRW
jgi:hypothetical protein